jgi:hypothetical protein
MQAFSRNVYLTKLGNASLVYPKAVSPLCLYLSIPKINPQNITAITLFNQSETFLTTASANLMRFLVLSPYSFTIFFFVLRNYPLLDKGLIGWSED